jgi:integral membrane protein (TIGR01906 family)
MNRFYSFLSRFITFITPLALLGLSVRILLTPLFPNFEYRLPYFAPDPYGFTTQDRLHWGVYGIDYLLNNADISYLGNLKFDDGTPLFTEPELSHMQDVKSVVQAFLNIWYIALAALILLGIWAWRAQWMKAYSQGLRRGGWLMCILAFALGIIATVGASGSGDLFWQFFSTFHGLFFEGSSWLFPDSDTLIRLYPLQFWQDAVLYIGVISAVGGLVLAIGLKNNSNHDV